MRHPDKAVIALLLLLWVTPPPACNAYEYRLDFTRFTNTTGLRQGQELFTISASFTGADYRADPLPGSCVWWTIEAYDSNGRLTCPVAGITADGQAWEGI